MEAWENGSRHQLPALHVAGVGNGVPTHTYSLCRGAHSSTPSSTTSRHETLRCSFVCSQLESTEDLERMVLV